MNIIAELLLSYIDLSVMAIEAFDPYKIYGKPTKEYMEWRSSRQIKPRDSSHLRSGKYLVEKNNNFILTPKANRTITRYMISELRIPIPDKWDCVWFVIIFDIPEEHRRARDIFRKHLKDLGLEMIQKSVFCYPYDCIREVTFLAKIYRLERYITYLEVSNIITGKDIFKIFSNRNILK